MSFQVNTSLNNRDILLSNWQDAKKQLAHYKELEMTLRADVIAACSEENDSMYSGTERVDIGQGYDLKITHKLNYSLNQETVDSALDKIEKECEHGTLLAERLVKVKYELSVTEYKQLPDAARKIIDQVLTIKPASKEVEIVKQSKRTT